MHWLNESNISWASCKAIIWPLIKDLLSHLSGQGGQLVAYKLGDVDYIFLSSVFLRSFNSMPVMAPQAHALTYFHQEKKTKDEAKILNVIKIFIQGYECKVRSEEREVKSM